MSRRTRFVGLLLLGSVLFVPSVAWAQAPQGVGQVTLNPSVHAPSSPFQPGGVIKMNGEYAMTWSQGVVYDVVHVFIEVATPEPEWVHVWLGQNHDVHVIDGLEGLQGGLAISEFPLFVQATKAAPAGLLVTVELTVTAHTRYGTATTGPVTAEIAVPVGYASGFEASQVLSGNHVPVGQEAVIHVDNQANGASRFATSILSKPDGWNVLTPPPIVIRAPPAAPHSAELPVQIGRAEGAASVGIVELAIRQTWAEREAGDRTERIVRLALQPPIDCCPDEENPAPGAGLASLMALLGVAFVSRRRRP